jgi:hypothetical protein
MIKDEMGTAIATRNFSIFERICVFLLPYLWELDVEINQQGAIEPDGDCYEDWVDFFVEQSSALSNELYGDKTRRSFRYHIDSDGYLISSAGVQREIKLGFYNSAAAWSLELCKNCNTFPRDAVESLLMSLPIYQLVEALLQLDKEQSKKLKSANSECLDAYKIGTFYNAAETVTKSFEKSIVAVVSKPWALLCRALLLKTKNRPEKCVAKLMEGLRIASHHNMQSCMAYLYLNLAQVEKAISGRKKLHNVGKVTAGIMNINNPTSSSPKQRGSPKDNSVGPTRRGQVRPKVKNVGTSDLDSSDSQSNSYGSSGSDVHSNYSAQKKTSNDIYMDHTDMIYMAHAKAAMEISERCGLTHVYFTSSKLVSGAGDINHMSSFRRAGSMGFKGGGRGEVKKKAFTHILTSNRSQNASEHLASSGNLSQISTASSVIKLYSTRKENVTDRKFSVAKGKQEPIKAISLPGTADSEEGSELDLYENTRRYSVASLLSESGRLDSERSPSGGSSASIASISKINSPGADKTAAISRNKRTSNTKEKSQKNLNAMVGRPWMTPGSRAFSMRSKQRTIQKISNDDPSAEMPNNPFELSTSTASLASSYVDKNESSNWDSNGTTASTRHQRRRSRMEERRASWASENN